VDSSTRAGAAGHRPAKTSSSIGDQGEITTQRDLLTKSHLGFISMILGIGLMFSVYLIFLTLSASVSLFKNLFISRVTSLVVVAY